MAGNDSDFKSRSKVDGDHTLHQKYFAIELISLEKYIV